MNKFRSILPATSAILVGVFFIASCGNPNPAKIPILNTPSGGKVNLTNVTLSVTPPTLTRTAKNDYVLSFDYTVDNQAGGHIVFPCLYNNTDELIEVNLSDKENKIIMLGRRPLEGLTLTEPKPLRIPSGKTTRHYKVPLTLETRKPEEFINIRIRLHTPSRYDELRSSIEAPRSRLPWPSN